jgi:acyl-coenzyme A thioesterase PaaI-like protein
VPADFETRVRESFARQGLMRTLGAELEEVGEGTTAIRLPRGEALSQQHGYVHAGALIAVVDTACGYAALTVAPPDSEVLTSELRGRRPLVLNVRRASSPPAWTRCSRRCSRGDR